MSDKDIEKVDVTEEEDVEEAEDTEEEDTEEEADDEEAEEADDEDADDAEDEEEDEDEDDLAKENARLRRLLKKKSKRQAIAKSKKAKGKKITSGSGNTPSVDDMFVVTANQLDQSEYEYAQKVAELEDLDLAEAVSSPLFKGWRKQYKEDLKKEQAALGTSRGSGKRKVKKTFATVTKRDDHKALWKKAQGQS